MSPITVFYHHNCADGFTAAWAAWLKYTNLAIYIGENHKFTETKKLIDQLSPGSGEHTAFYLDICPPAELIRELQGLGCHVTVLDHHETAFEDIETANRYTYSHNIRSGAYLAWNHFHKDEEVPYLVHLVQDRDLWNWNLPHSKELCAWLDTIPKTFADWVIANEVLSSQELMNIAIGQGTAIMAYQTLERQQILQKAHTVWIDGLGWVPAVNSPTMQSELGNDLAADAPKQAAAIWWFDGATRQYRYSLRGVGDCPHLGKIAKQYGGGGHHKAAGFHAGPPVLGTRYDSE